MLMRFLVADLAVATVRCPSLFGREDGDGTGSKVSFDDYDMGRMTFLRSTSEQSLSKIYKKIFLYFYKINI